MSRRLKKNIPFLHALAKGSQPQRKGILQGAKKDLLETICECALNVLHGNVPLSSSEKRKLKSHKHTLRNLCNRKIALQNKKRKLLNQKGGFLPALIAPIIASLVGDIAVKGIQHGIRRRRQRQKKK